MYNIRESKRQSRGITSHIFDELSYRVLELKPKKKELDSWISPLCGF